MISIIIPVYNVQDYLERCLDSILAQTHTDFEVICVNDGSKDDSGKICDKYKEQDNRIKVYHIENHGVSYVRNYGLSLMEGDWFCFVDSDDWLEPNYLERMYELAKEKQCELVACGFEKAYEYSIGVKGAEERVFVFETSKTCIENFICNKNSMQGFSWNKLYNAEKFKDIKFDETVKVNEDCLYTYEIMSVCEKACLTTLPLYHWYMRPDSACHKRAERADFRAANVFLYLMEKLPADMITAQRVLKKNYVSSVVQVLLFAKYDKKDAAVIGAIKNCKKWKREVWSGFGTKQKLKYWCSIYFRRVLM